VVPLRIGVPPGPAAQTGNRYAFATGNPLLAADPSGHFNNHLIMPVRLFGSLTLQFVPLVGDGYALFAGVTGYDPIAGISLSPEERALIVGGMIGIGTIAVIAARLRGLAPRVGQVEELAGVAAARRYGDDVVDLGGVRYLDEAGEGGRPGPSTSAPRTRASFGEAASTDYRTTFSAAHPDVQGPYWVHHAVEQQALKKYPTTVSAAEIHSVENLRGIPLDINGRIHLSKIRRIWNEFYRAHPHATREELLEQASLIDDLFGHLFTPPVR
jgi:hypothetical protein